MGGFDFNERLGLVEVKQVIWKALVAEVLGNFMLNYFGCMSCVAFASGTSHVVIALTFGLAIMAIVQSVGHVSGAHVNPAVTCAMLATGNITIIKGILYIVAQCVGAIAGSAFLKALTPDILQGNLGTTMLGKQVQPLQGFGIEFMLGFVLVIVVFGVCDANRPEGKGFAPLVIGLAIALGHLSSLNYTGSSMNPARSLGSAVISGIWNDHWVYWLGPILGGMCAGLLYKFVLSAAPVESRTEYSPVQLKRLDNKKEEDGLP
ncbi:hypothetical protein L9F63_000350 [Diploptera punctata]|uniref:Uncharacterized protein n=1 Tax=Diploptera punctata TaxID=6984 RepID=A0AAD8ETA9_DIPPU|nr:hypothetical protein L9F63_000350 [Diploptera punctata]